MASPNVGQQWTAALMVVTTDKAFEIENGLVIENVNFPQTLINLLCENEACITGSEVFISTHMEILVYDFATGEQLREVPISWEWAQLSVFKGRVYTFNENAVYLVNGDSVKQRCTTSVAISNMAVLADDDEDTFKFCYQGEDFRLYLATCNGQGHLSKEEVVFEEILLLIGTHEDSIFVQACDDTLMVIQRSEPIFYYSLDGSVQDWLSCGHRVYFRICNDVYAVDTLELSVTVTPDVPSGNLILRENFD